MKRTKQVVLEAPAGSASAPRVISIPFTEAQLARLVSLLHPDRHAPEYQARAAELFSHVRKYSV